jgi:Ca2+-binding RTX toxin-like protein
LTAPAYFRYTGEAAAFRRFDPGDFMLNAVFARPHRRGATLSFSLRSVAASGVIGLLAFAGPAFAQTCHGLAPTTGCIVNHVVGPCIGTSANDRIDGTGGDDVIVGMAGNDRIDGESGNDVICGGPGDDRLLGDNGDDLVDGGGGNDLVSGRRGADVLYGRAGDDKVRCDHGVDVGYGGTGVDHVKGSRDEDLLYGGPELDRVQGGNGIDECSEDDDVRDCETLIPALVTTTSTSTTSTIP